ncbi:MAG TPA: DUF3108 domain-containing protein [Paludibacteraceae bacterium]|nr:DUF3108 domain-containing protein [Paludibacteraceae bacterium]HPH62944.1 DUF3108 domain-containing protein [Paludibacteraceae bacterium]
MKRVFIGIILLISFWSANLVNAQVRYMNESVFHFGEHATYNVYFNWGFIWIHAGNVEFQVKNMKVGNKDCYYLFVSGYTRKAFDKMYTIRDTFSSCVDTKYLLPVAYRETKHEDSYFCDKIYKYQRFTDSTKVFMDFTRNTKKWLDTLVVNHQSCDLITTCYKFRNLDMSTVQKNMVVNFNMIFDSEVYNLGLKYCGKEQIKLKNGKKYNALKFVPKLITGDLFKNEDDMVIYVTDDNNHVPLLIDAKIKVGSIKAMLQDVAGTKFPVPSLLK